MTTRCKATYKHTPDAEPHHCGLPQNHDGAHRSYYSYRLNYHWPNSADEPKAAHPAGKGSGKTVNWAHVVDAELDRIKNETHVLLSKEDLITISYYLPFYTDDDDDPDNITKAKIDTALKKLL